MKDLKQILFVILELTILIGIVVGCCYSSVFRWITPILVIVLVIVFVWLYLNRDKYSNPHSPENIWGKDWQKLVDEGKLSTTKPYKCRTNWHFSDRNRIEECAGVQLPRFKVLNCAETLRQPIGRYDSFIGDYCGFLDIEFRKDLSDLSVQKIKSIPSSKWSHYKGTRYKCTLSNGAFCKWCLDLALDSRIARIEYSIMEK